MLSAYPACFFRDTDGYTVVFPDLNWLATCGDTLDEALAAAIDCLAGYLYTCQLKAITVQPASDVNAIDLLATAEELDIKPQEQFVNIVTVDVSEYAKVHFEKSVKKTLSIPAWLNDEAIKQGINFSKVLQEALKAHLHIG